jgi:hypothetical protein
LESVRGIVKKKPWFILFLALLFLLLASTTQASLQIWPGKLTISMPEGYPTERISYQIHVTNPQMYPVNASASVKNPDVQQLTANYSYIPDLSWVTVEPETLYIPANTTSTFDVFLNIPPSQQSSYYNESWETWVIISSETPSNDTGGLVFQVDLAVKLFIHTPIKENVPSVGIFFIVLGIITAGGVILILLRYTKKNIPEK